MQAIVYRTIAFSAAFSNRKLGRIETKGGGLGPDNKKWVGSYQEEGRFHQTPVIDLCRVPCLRGFFSSSLGKKGHHQKSVSSLFLSNLGEDQTKRTSPKLNSLFRKFLSITITLSRLGPEMEPVRIFSIRPVNFKIYAS